MHETPPYLLGIDAGTTALKAVLFDSLGTTLASATQEYSLLTGPGGIVELDPETYWSALKSALKALFSQTGGKQHEVLALAISSQGESFVPIDSNGNPLCKTIVWLDSRSTEEAAIIEKEFDAENIYHTSGSPEVNATWASTKLLWLRRHEPALFAKIGKVLFVEDYLIYRLTGRFAANGALWCSSLLYDINANRWWDDMLRFLGLSTDQLPPLYGSGVPVAKVVQSVADELGFSNTPLVVTAGMDQACGCIGTGNLTPGVVTENTGASLNIAVTLDRPTFDPQRRVPCQTHVLPGKYIYLPWCKTAGMFLKWFRDNFCEAHRHEAECQHRDVYDLLTHGATNIPPGSGGVVVLPHLAGAMSPEMDDNARGVIFGLDLSSTRDHVVRAILESIAYMLRANIELLEQSKIAVQEVILSGAAARSVLWNQIKTDVLGKKTKIIKNKEACCLGAAILAGLGAGVFSSAEDACKMIIADDTHYLPDPAAHQAYGRYYEAYKEVYLCLRPVFQRKLAFTDMFSAEHA
jgi:xylulokinase